MQITGSALSLNVADVEASAEFAIRHLGFAPEMSADGFVSLAREDAGFNLIFLRTGLGTFKPASHAGAAGQGTLVAFVVDDIDAEYERLRGEGARIVGPSMGHHVAHPAQRLHVHRVMRIVIHDTADGAHR